MARDHRGFHSVCEGHWPAGAALCLALALAAWPAGAQAAEPAPAAAAASLPAERQQGSIRYTTGGVTEDEAAAFKRERHAYPLSIEVLEQAPGRPRAQYTADAMVRIANPAGQTVFEARADGPFMLVRLPHGRYTVSATLGARTLQRQVTVGSGERAAQASFVFPASAE